MTIEPGSLEHRLLRELVDGKAATQEEVLEALLAQGLDVDMAQLKDIWARFVEHGLLGRELSHRELRACRWGERMARAVDQFTDDELNSFLERFYEHWRGSDFELNGMGELLPGLPDIELSVILSWTMRPPEEGSEMPPWPSLAEAMNLQELLVREVLRRA